MKKDLRPAITTLLHSWGSDTPQEVFWGLNELAVILHGEKAITLPDPVENAKNEQEYNEKYDKFLEQFII